MKQHTTPMFSFTFLICNLFNVMRLSYNLTVAGPGDLLQKNMLESDFSSVFYLLEKKYSKKIYSEIGKARKFRPKSTIITGNCWELERLHFLIEDSCNSSFYLSSISFYELLEKY